MLPFTFVPCVADLVSAGGDRGDDIPGETDSAGESLRMARRHP